MTGHEQVIALRRQGVRPVCLWVSDYAAMSAGDGVTVRLTPQDVPEQLDWRFAVGLTVLVDGHDARRVERIAAACKQFAKRVVATVYGERIDRAGRPYAAVDRINDTEGLLTWPSC